MASSRTECCCENSSPSVTSVIAPKWACVTVLSLASISMTWSSCSPWLTAQHIVLLCAEAPSGLCNWMWGLWNRLQQWIQRQTCHEPEVFLSRACLGCTAGLHCSLGSCTVCATEAIQTISNCCWRHLAQTGHYCIYCTLYVDECPTQLSFLTEICSMVSSQYAVTAGWFDFKNCFSCWLQFH